MVNRIVMALSGGMDSVTLLAYYLNKGYEVICISFSYGSKHNKYEHIAAVNVSNFYGVEHFFVNLAAAFQYVHSDLLKTGGEIPEGHYAEESMRATVVPGRNLLFAAAMASFAESQGITRVALGVHQGDHHIYPDCRPMFIENLNRTVQSSTDDLVSVEAPFLFQDKTKIIALGMGLDVPYQLTRTCYKDQPLACGKCGSCTERLEGFANNGIKDPAPYEEGVN